MIIFDVANTLCGNGVIVLRAIACGRRSYGEYIMEPSSDRAIFPNVIPTVNYQITGLQGLKLHEIMHYWSMSAHEIRIA